VPLEDDEAGAFVWRDEDHGRDVGASGGRQLDSYSLPGEGREKRRFPSRGESVVRRTAT
jgi:hypothetical protein